jgi:DNA-binding transcriptional LysR family regulator
MDRFAEMRAFCAVAGSGGFSAAARDMGLATSSVTRLVDALERRLGAMLLHRSTRSVTLTVAGRTYYDESQRILAQVDAADDAITDCESGDTGTLRVAAPATFAAMCITPILPAMRARFPHLNFELQVDDAAVNLTDDSTDLAIRTGNLDPNLNLVARRLSDYRRLMCASPAYLERCGVPLCPADLIQHDCLQFSFAENLNTWRVRRNDGARPPSESVDGVEEVPIKTKIIANYGEVIRHAALDGMGIAVLAHWLVQADLAAGRLVRVLANYDANPGPMDMTIHALYHGKRRGTKKIQVFIELLSAHIA